MKKLVSRLLGGGLLRHVLIRNGRRSGRRMAITFDDGPDAEFTPRVLDALRSEQVRATFFLLGREAEEEKELVKKIAGEGHEIGIHGFDHTHADISGQARRCDRLLSEAGIRTRLFRPPGAMRLDPALILRLSIRGYRTVLWSFDTHDSMRYESKWDGPAPDYGRIAAGDIVLMHDDNPVCVNELPELIREVRRIGLEPVTVSELAW